MIRRLSLIAVLACSTCTVAHAQRLSSMQAGRFGQICSRPAGKAVCDAYIAGVADAGALSRLNAKGEGDADAVAGFCIPDSETTDAMRNHVVSWLRAHKDVLNQPVGKSVFAALHDSYACGGGK